MTFEEWFDDNYGDTELANDHELGGDFYCAMRSAWEAGRDTVSNEFMWIYGD